MNRYAIGMGSNEGDRLSHLTGAVAEVAELAASVDPASIYETAPVGGPDQDPYLNSVVVVEMELGPLELLDALQAMELSHGRRRTVRWGPRTLDLDIVAWDGSSLRDERLTLPHPRAAQREFVLRPLVEVWPEAPVGGGLTAAEALESIDPQGVDHLATDWIHPTSRVPGYLLVAGQFAIVAAAAIGFASDGSLPDGGEVGAFRVIGTALAAFGAIFAFISSRRLGPAVTPHPTPRPEARLIERGPYRLVRHPIYGGVSLFLIGTAMILDSILGVALSALLIPYFLFKSSYEERQLRLRFAGYRSYMESTPRRLIPFVL